MKINVIPLRSDLSKSNKDVDLISKAFLDNINDELFDDDLTLEINAKDALFSVFLIETGGSEEKFLKYTDGLKDPIILLSTEKNNSLPACFEIKTYLEQKGFNPLLINGSEKDVSHFFSHMSEVISASNKLHNMNLGVIGEPSNWLIASKVDFGKVYNKFGINLIKIGEEELIYEINKKKYGTIPHITLIRKKYKDIKTLEMSLYIYGALKRLIEKYHLSGFTIRCFDLLEKFKNTSCLALAILNEEGYICACEGDVPSLITMAVIKAISDQSSFMANPSSIDFPNNKMILSHCTVPLNMVSKYEILTHFESNLGTAIKGEMMKKEVTICKITPDLNGIVLLNGTIEENLSLPCYCRTQILVNIDNNRIMTLLEESFGNHLIVTYGNISDLLFSFVGFISLKQEK